MKITIDEYSIYCTLNNAEELKNKIPVLFLHGFTGSSQDWRNVFQRLDSNFLPFAIDLIGHGQSDSPVEPSLYTQAAITKQVKLVLEFFSINEILICGYSMGGRVALSFYFAYPQVVKGLVLESTNPGIQDDKSVIERIKADNELIRILENNNIKTFIDYWYSLPLFSSLQNLTMQEFNDVLNSRFNNSAIGLINSLKGFGTGKMNNFWNELNNINIPLLWISGELDNKYCRISELALELVPHTKREIISSAGHNTHLEKPSEFVSLVNSFLRNYFI